MIGIYIIINLVNDKVYVGSSQDVKQRIRLHRSQLKKNIHGNSHLQNSYNKYGKDSFKFEIIEETTIADLEIREQFFIYKLKSNNRDCGYNKRVVAGTNRGVKWSEESKKKLSKSKKGITMHPNTRAALIKANTGSKKVITKEWRNILLQNISKANLSNRKGVDQYDLEGNFIQSFESSKEASIATGVAANSIGLVCRKQRNKAGNYYWCFKGESFQKRLRKNTHKYKLLDINKICIQIFDSKQELASFLEIAVSSVQHYSWSKKVYNNKYYFQRIETLCSDTH